MEPFHKFFDHTDDVLFVAKAETLLELFQQCALAVGKSLVELEEVKPTQKIKILSEDNSPKNLLLDFLDELVFFSYYQHLLFNKFEISLDEKEGIHRLTCYAYGEKFDLTKHNLKVKVKTVPKDSFKLEKVNNVWKAQVLLKK